MRMLALLACVQVVEVVNSVLSGGDHTWRRGAGFGLNVGHCHAVQAGPVRVFWGADFSIKSSLLMTAERRNVLSRSILRPSSEDSVNMCGWSTTTSLQQYSDRETMGIVVEFWNYP